MPLPSANVCLSIWNNLVTVLMSYRQNGVPEFSARRRIGYLLEKLKDKPEELETLIQAITLSGSLSSKCVTMPRIVDDGNYKADDMNTDPRVIYARIWRWSDVGADQLKSITDCQFAFHLDRDHVCVNPYHCQRIIPPAANQSGQVTISLWNPSSKLMAFKVKTTTPKRYYVRPNGGIIKGGQTVSVNMVRQPGPAHDKDAQECARHKFLVQAIFIDNDQVQWDQVWRDVQKDKIMETKLTCQFEDSDEVNNGAHVPDGAISNPGNPIDLTASLKNAATAAAAAHPLM